MNISRLLHRGIGASTFGMVFRDAKEGYLAARLPPAKRDRHA